MACSSGGSDSEDPADQTYSVTYHTDTAGSGTPPVDDTKYKYNDMCTVLGITESMMRKGYLFNNWTTDNDWYMLPGISFAIQDNVDFYPEWIKTGFSVTYSDYGADSGTVPVDNNVYLSGEVVTVLGNPGSLVKANYQFDGWFAGGNIYAVGDTFTITTGVQMIANWTYIGGTGGGGTGGGGTGGGGTGGGTITHSYTDVTAATTALSSGLSAAALTTDSSSSAYNVSNVTSSPMTCTYYFKNYVYSGITLNGSISSSTNLTTYAVDMNGTITVTGNDVSKIVYNNIHIASGVSTGTYGFEFTDGTSWIYDLSAKTFKEN